MPAKAIVLLLNNKKVPTCVATVSTSGNNNVTTFGNLPGQDTKGSLYIWPRLNPVVLKEQHLPLLNYCHSHSSFFYELQAEY